MDNYSPSFNEDIFYKIPLQGGLKTGKGELRPEALKQLGRTLEAHNEVQISVWIDPRNGVFEFIGQAKVKLKELSKGLKKSLTFYDRKKKKECRQDTRQVEIQCKLVSGFNKEMNTSVSLELVMFPFLDESEFTFGEVPSKSITRINPLVHGLLERKFDSEAYHKFVTSVIENFEEEITKTRLQNFKSVFIEDQVGEVHFLSTFLCPVDLKVLSKGNSRAKLVDKDKGDQQLSDVDLIQLNNEFEIFQFVNCLQYQTDLTKKLVLSPDFLMSQNKGDVSDHAILLACLLMGLR